MTGPTTLPGTNAEGFIPLARLRRAARGGSFASFVDTYPVPAIRVVAIDPVGDRGAGSTPGVFVPRLETLSKSGDSIFRYFDEVAFLHKRPGSPLPQFVCVGRAPNNDVVMGVEGVSKLHGYFIQKQDRWLVADYHSTNGMLLNGARIDPDAEYPVASRDRIRWGDQIVTEFLTPEELYGLARREPRG